MRLFIAEKPSVAKAIANVIGIDKSNKNYIECKDGTLIAWCFGHLYELAEPDAYTDDNAPRSKKTNRKMWRWEDLPIIPKVWQTNPKEEHKEHINMLFGLIRKCDCIIHAGDPDREGQLLVDEVIEKAGFTGKVLRYWANAIDDKSIKKALDNLENNSKYEPLSNAALARQRCDWLVGMNITRATTLLHHDIYTVGRVQTPTLNLVYQRDQAIKNFKSIDFNVLKIDVKANNGNYQATFQPSETQAGLDEEGRLIDSSVAQDIADSCKNKDAKVISVKKTKKTVNQPKGFSLAELTATASRVLNFTAAQTLKVAQSLYEKKCTSYPRTDCCFLPNSQYEDKSFILDSISLICEKFKDACQSVKDSTIKSKIWNDEKTTAHHAIIPTFSDTKVDLTDAEMKLYELIAKRYIVQFMKAHEYEHTEVITQVDAYNFKTIGKRILVNGFKDFDQEKDEDDNKEQESNNLPELNEGDIGTVINTNIQKQKTQPPKYFTEGTLITAMENIHRYVDNEDYKKLLKDGDGIGTSATRASIIEELKKREFIKVDGKFIKSTEKGANLLANISEQVKSPIMTANFESVLTEIAENQRGIGALLDQCVDFVSGEITSARAKSKLLSKKVSTIDCPYCKEKMIEQKFTFSCEKCGFKLNKEIAQATPSVEYFKQVLNKEDVPPLVFTSKENKQFKAKLALDYENKKLVFKFEPKESSAETSKFNCPECGKPLIRRESKNKKGLFWYGCSGYPKCELTFFEKDGKPDIYPNSDDKKKSNNKE